MEQKLRVLHDNNRVLNEGEFDDQINFQLDPAYLHGFERPKGLQKVWNGIRYILKDYLHFTKTWLSGLVTRPWLHWNRPYQQDKILQEVVIQRSFREKIQGIRRTLLFLGIEKEPLTRPRSNQVKSAGILALGETLLPWTRFQGVFHNHSGKYPNLRANVALSRAEQLWIADITLTHTKEGKRCFYIITDAFTHRVMGYAVSQEITAASAIKALKMALANRKYYGHLIHHSQKGVHYCIHRYVQLLKECQITLSASEG